jgi:hypothetical protein
MSLGVVRNFYTKFCGLNENKNHAYQVGRRRTVIQYDHKYILPE